MASVPEDESNAVNAQPWLEKLTHEECVELLGTQSVGRVGFLFDGFPMVLPVNYRLVETSGRMWLALRTRSGNVLERADTPVALEIDSIDAHAKQGWSVLVHGTLQHVDPDAADFRERFDPQPWMDVDRDAWLVIEPFEISGRRLHPATQDWAFDPAAYL